ncbi:MAG: 5-methyltetrahydropteroyltriglutamate--homocysteine S-methyltransferase [Candidatus Omnitrophica bacterium]|nr:5-methyltetrahydropteroyltriglutamate--homocysteine S-methyltransferase [Candidatus Omnitrophota bacterium]
MRTASLGFPRIGKQRELKKATESFWKGGLSAAGLFDVAKKIRRENWERQKGAGIDIIPSNDFSLYDQMLDMSCLLGAVPDRFEFKGETVDLDTYFAMARGGSVARDAKGPSSVTAMEMSKWFDTNYHYIVPELKKDQAFRIAGTKVFDEFREARELGIQTRPVLIGPLTYLLLGKCQGEPFDVLQLLDGLVEVYIAILKRLSGEGAQSVQLDEPILVTDTQPAHREALIRAYKRIAVEVPNLKVTLATYFEAVTEPAKLLESIPVAGWHVDGVRSFAQIPEFLNHLPKDKEISLGVVEGRNVWITDLEATVCRLRKALDKEVTRPITIASSCSLIHVPVDLDQETALDKEIRSWMAFASQKLDEIRWIASALREGDGAVQKELENNRMALNSRAQSPRVRVAAVRERMAAVAPKDFSRQKPREERLSLQKEALGLPPYPTTTIGSFPQTPEVRKMRLKFKKREIDSAEYEKFLEQQIADAVERQTGLGLDVLVHGEFERNDMVEYFGEQLDGFVFTQNGWVQSYGSRCVKPPVIYGDVSRPQAMTVRWFRYAQGLTQRIMKGMLTGPVTILQWSFVRNDQERSETAFQIGLAIRDEVADLEKAGARIIQIDEAAFREGLPLKQSGWADYLQWAVKAFRLSCSVADAKTQIHTHMCYSEFNDIIEAISDMDADVISIECSRSRMELLEAFRQFRYPGEIGPGVYDIHSPRVPSREEIERLLHKAMEGIPAERLWVNPDCGLKTRGWAETTPSLEAMVEAAKNLRALKPAER